MTGGRPEADGLDRLPQALLVDLDDTVVSDSSRSGDNWRAACEAVAATSSLPLPLETILAALDRERGWFWSDPERHREGRRDLVAARRRIVDGALRRAGTVDAALAEAIADAYGARAEADRTLLPGALAAIREIRGLGMRLALVTNGAEEAQQAKIERFGLAPLFHAVVIEGALGAGKPEPAVYTHALALLGVEPRDAWMVGDNLEWDVAAPQRLGMRAVWVDMAGRGLPPDSGVCPNAIVSGLTELAAILVALAARA